MKWIPTLSQTPAGGRCSGFARDSQSRHRCRSIQSLLPDLIHHAQQCRGNFQIKNQLAVPQSGQQVLSDMRDFFQLVESQKTARTF
jgi:hypothetical protein